MPICDAQVFIRHDETGAKVLYWFTDRSTTWKLSKRQKMFYASIRECNQRRPAFITMPGDRGIVAEKVADTAQSG